MYINTLPRSEKSTHKANKFPAPEIPISEALARSRREAKRLRRIFPRDDVRAHIVGGVELFLGEIQEGRPVTFQNFLGFIRFLTNG